jgi:VIT1/CCC1 family predicted Fe2+/Mn2+ transporter
MDEPGTSSDQPGPSVRPPAGAAPRASAAAMSGAAPGPSVPGGARSAQHAEILKARQELEAIRRHHGSTGRSGSLRAAVFGINDGLVSNFSLVLGMAGADLGAQVVILAGVAGLVAGAFSMAAGEYVSMRVQREVFEGALALERRELEEEPEEEQREVEVILRAQGVPREDAERIAPQVIADPAIALDLMARQELGLNPDELGSPVGAALSSFGAFAVGALIPLLPFVLLRGGLALGVAVALSALSLFIVGALAARLSGRPGLFGGARMLLIGAAAAAVTYGIGKAFGVTMAG